MSPSPFFPPPFSPLLFFSPRAFRRYGRPQPDQGTGGRPNDWSQPANISAEAGDPGDQHACSTPNCAVDPVFNPFGIAPVYGTFRLKFHHFDRIELDLRGHIHVRGAAFSCLRLKWADIVLN